MLRLGVIGTNWITEAFIQAAQETEQFSLTAVYSRTEDRAKAFAAKHSIPHTFTDIQSLAQCEEVDAVYIASPNSYHAQHAIACLNGNKHVLCEKPIASNANELRGMQAAARSNGVVLMEAVKSTLNPNFLAVIDNLPKIGTVRRFVASYCQYSSRYDAYKQGTVLNAFNPIFSNGALMDLGVYCVYPLAVLFGKPDRIQANAYMLESGVDGQGSLLLSYGQMEATIHYSKIVDSTLPTEIQGESGTLIIDRINQPESVRIRYRDGSMEDITQPQTGLHSPMYYEAMEFMNLAAGGQLESDVNSHRSSIVAMEIMDEARRQIGLVYPADIPS